MRRDDASATFEYCTAFFFFFFNSFTPTSPEGYAGYNYWSLSLRSMYIVPLHARSLRLVRACRCYSACGPCSGPLPLVEIGTFVISVQNQALRSVPLLLRPMVSLSGCRGASHPALP